MNLLRNNTSITTQNIDQPSVRFGGWSPAMRYGPVEKTEEKISL